MPLFTDDIVAEFSDMDRYHLNIDRSDYVDSGQWVIGDEIPLENIVAAFRRYDELNYQSDQGVILPLHEENSAELTGEFIVYYKDDRFDDNTLLYQDSDEGGTEYVEIGDADQTYLGYRLRFWHPSYEPPSIPSYMSTETWAKRQMGPSREIESEATLCQEELVELIDDLSEFIAAERTNDASFERLSNAIAYARRNNHMKRILSGEKTLRFGSPIDSVVRSDTLELNQFQRAAAESSLRAKDVFCIHGPPGTGKTRTLVALIKKAVDRGSSVLVCAHSNQAVDNLLVGTSTSEEPDPTSLHGLALENDFTLQRIGRDHQIHPLVRENYMEPVSGYGNVVATTTNSAGRLKDHFGDPKVRFRYTVVDEASQATIPSTLIPAELSQRLILAGDHRQLPPYCSNEDMREENFHISLFEHLMNIYGDQIAITLQRQYRMNEKIASFPNQAFYDGSLEHGEQNQDWQLGDRIPLRGINVEREKKGENELEEDGRCSGSDSPDNEAEAEIVTAQVHRLLRDGVSADDIGVITPYNGQVGLIEQSLTQLDVPPRRIEVNTIDSFQGSEREAIIVSFVRSNPEGNSGFLEFPQEGPRRLNVALTRARKRCVLIGDWDTLATQYRHDSCASYYTDLYKHLVELDVLTG